MYIAGGISTIKYRFIFLDKVSIASVVRPDPAPISKILLVFCITLFLFKTSYSNSEFILSWVIIS
jgi:hypothetical protein